MVRLLSQLLADIVTGGCGGVAPHDVREPRFLYDVGPQVRRGCPEDSRRHPRRQQAPGPAVSPGCGGRRIGICNCQFISPHRDGGIL